MFRKSRLKIKSVLFREFSILQRTAHDGMLKFKPDIETAKLFLDRFEKFRFVSWQKGELLVKIGYFNIRK